MNTSSTPSVPFEAETHRARIAQEAWSRLPIRKRLIPLREFRHRIVEGTDALAAAVARDIGKEPFETLGGDLIPLADACLFLEKEAEKILRPRRVSTSHRPIWLMGQSDTIYRRPRGVVGIIGTWNYPHLLNGVQIVQALIAGNAVLWKPSELSRNSAVALADLLQAVGFPRDLFQMLPPTREAGPQLTEADIDYLVFTGSAPVGRQIARHLGGRLIPSSLELSGCDAMFVLEDADVSMASRAAWFGCVLNNGQTCIGVRRVFVHRSLYEPFCTQLRSLASEAVPRRLALPNQVLQARQLVREALELGAKLLVDLPDAPDDSFTPTLLVDVPATAQVCREATFAPLTAVIPVESLEQALVLDSLCPYGLGASIFTRNLARAGTIAAQLRTGTVLVNDVIVGTAHPAVPFGGQKESGWGSTRGEEGLLEMTVPQVVGLRSNRFRPHYDMVKAGAGANQTEQLTGMLRATHARTFWQRMRGWGQLFWAFWRGK